MEKIARSWTILLLGGHSGAGKTSAARQLSKIFDVPWIEADDIRLALQKIVSPLHSPALHFFLANADVWSRSPEELCAHLQEVGSVVSLALEGIINHHLLTQTPLIIEGDGILPYLATQPVFGGLEAVFPAAQAGSSIRTIFLQEPQEKIIAQDINQRWRGLSPHLATTWSRLHWLYGQWLSTEAQHHGIPVVEAHPWETLIQRLLPYLTE
ncbi:hypothetical protein [Tengunoibacter tsumagoiensis]|uniref:2-phosphoglycerate kinase n=1 Tax=Tengunoibacter tsumagoiensis TaxID=2014871 RepID=A0A402A8A9_9CHLR|nr:hypothetical protein [Tengunoibacter tsumagoiensis]GCE15236.1 hypothetical protein KTT_50950 [Tengunoibacter tsumagoiensis]